MKTQVARGTLASGLSFIEAMLDLPAPVIAVVNGGAAGFGATRRALSFIVLMAQTAFIAKPDINIKFVIGDGISVSWLFLVPLNKPKELAFTGYRLFAAGAAACGWNAVRIDPGPRPRADRACLDIGAAQKSRVSARAALFILSAACAGKDRIHDETRRACGLRVRELDEGR